MSISNRHQFAILDKNSKAMSGQRLARVIAKKTEGVNHPNLPESLCISIPFIDRTEVESNIAALIPHLIDLLADTQNALIKEIRIESGANEIADDEIGIAACLKYLEASSKGGRITSEYLTEWMKETYSIQAAEFIAIACKFDPEMDNWTDAQTGLIEQKSNVLFSMFAGFASGKYSPPIPLCKAMGRFGEFLGNGIDSRMGVYLNRAAKIQAEKEAELNSDALGF